MNAPTRESQPSGRSTMRDVAAAAGVSVKTVSRVVNGEGWVADATRLKVTAAMAELDFSPDMFASTLRSPTRRTRSIGLILSSADNPFDAAVSAAVERYARARNVSVLVSTTHEEPAREAELLAQLRSRRVDGLILMPAGGDEAGHLERAAADGVPVVAIDRQPPGWAGDCVVTDHREASKLATEHLLAAGHRSIAFVGHLPRISSAQARLAGYRQAMAEAGAPIDDNLVALGNHNAEIAHRTALRMLTSARPPTAFFSAQDVITLGVVRALHERGAQHRIALVGFDDVPLADLLDPPLTVIAQDPRLIGELAAERVFARQDHPGLPPETITVAGRLIRRGSGEIPPP